MKKWELEEIIKEEINKILLEDKNLLLSDRMQIENSILLGELLNPENAYNYEESKLRGLWTYYDINNNLFFVRLVYQPTVNPYFELKFGWFKDDDFNQPKYDPPIPENTTAKDWDKRSNTVAKIFKDETLPFFEKQELSNILRVIPLEIKRYLFAIRLVNKYVDKEKYEITENKPKEIKIVKKIL